MMVISVDVTSVGEVCLGLDGQLSRSVGQQVPVGGGGGGGEGGGGAPWSEPTTLGHRLT